MKQPFRRSVDEHHEVVRALLSELPGRLGSQEVPLADARGRILAANLLAPRNLPAFDNSQMDGFAVRRADLLDGSAVEVGAVIAAGDAAGTLPPKTAAPIMTGAMLPSGADAVVPIERADPPEFPAALSQPETPARPLTVRLPTDTPAGQFIRAAGSDIASGATALPAGTRLGPAQLGLAAALGLDRLTVTCRPRVLILSTGDEVRPPGSELAPGQIHDANTTLLLALFAEAGADVAAAGISTDAPEVFVADLAPRLGPTRDPAFELVVTSGGISKGAFEVVRLALADHGIDFGSVAMQPGGPQGAGLLELPGAAPTALLAFPGNPVSGVVSFELLARPAWEELFGTPPRARLRARLATDLPAPPEGKLQVRRAAVVLDDDGGAIATPVGGPGSHLVHALASSNALLMLPSGSGATPAGELVETLMYGALT
ncbi:molybdopterin molybdotransferase MoeA [Arthrobacter rhombi]|uniref:molybdopterin molybdotransferase MoeA n=1 Tax=Arthrobacter rhombi TaxID=71253 RepID=UPI003F9153A6